MNAVLGHDSALQGNTGTETTWANEMIFVMNHAPGTATVRPAVQRATTVLSIFAIILGFIIKQ